MRYLSFIRDGRASYGIHHEAGIHDLGARLGTVLPDLRTYLEVQALGGTPELPSQLITDCRPDDVAFLPPIPNPRKIFCIGLNYEDHRNETGRPKTAHPTVFTRFADTLIGHNAAIRIPSVSVEADFEGELAVIIGREGWRVSREDALDIVAGYACFNDVSIRDWQRHTSQYTPGKNFPATAPCGPALVTPDEMGELGALGIETRLNGAVMQRASLADMIFPVPELIAYISTFAPLAPGDIIATGTPGGVGFKRDPQVFLKPGDVFEVEIERAGLLRNTVESEAA
jgi:2-keto-4-pentenoate hydratase/2-oxohepta-3-ene-1,7-dioic acid hydratase in catechol pathway